MRENQSKRAWTRSSTTWQILVAVAVATTLLATGCSRGAGSEEVDRAEIQKFLVDYLPKVGEAYGTANARALEGMAVPKEIARTEKRIDELKAVGQTYKPEFKEVTVESASVWNHSNALVTTNEVWDVRAYALGSEEVVNESLGQRSRVKYQLKREGDSWIVLFRELDQTFDS